MNRLILLNNIMNISKRNLSNVSNLPINIKNLETKLKLTQRKVDILEYRINITEQKYKYNIENKISELYNKSVYKKLK